MSKDGMLIDAESDFGKDVRSVTCEELLLIQARIARGIGQDRAEELFDAMRGFSEGDLREFVEDSCNTAMEQVLVLALIASSLIATLCYTIEEIKLHADIMEIEGL